MVISLFAAAKRLGNFLADLREIGSYMLAVRYLPKGGFEGYSLQNLQTILLPTPRGDVPRVTYLGAKDPTIFDVDAAVRGAQRRTKFASVTIRDNSPNTAVYFLTEPIIPARLINTQVRDRVALVPRGGTSCHILDELDLPNIELEKLVERTLNKLTLTARKFPRRFAAANKLITIGTLHCLHKGKRVVLNNVVISKQQKGAKLYYRNPTSQKISAIHYKISTEVLEYEQSTVDVEVSEDQFLHALYTGIAQSTPSSEHLLTTTAGRSAQENFLEALKQVFWGDKTPPTAMLYEAALCLKKVFNRSLPSKPVAYNSNLSLALASLSEENGVPKAKLQEYLNRSLQIAVTAHNLETTRALVEGGANIHVTDDRGLTPLHYAAVNGDRDLLELLVDLGASVNSSDKEGRTALHHAVMAGSQSTTNALLERKANPDAEDCVGNTPLHYAVLVNKLELVRSLVDHRANTKKRALFQKASLLELSCLSPLSTKLFSKKLIAMKIVNLEEPFCCLDITTLFSTTRFPL